MPLHDSMQLNPSLANDSVVTDSPYTSDQLNQLQLNKLPYHVAIIPDGNRRWAKQNKLSILQGHRQGSDNLMQIAKAAKSLGIKVLTFYLFSTENWTRNVLELDALMWLLESYLIEQRSTMLELGVRFQTIGDLSRFSNRINTVIQETKAACAHCKNVDLVFALNYGSRDEICRAIRSIMQDFSKNPTLSREGVTESLISRYLDTAQWPDPDLLIRTSGEMRMSNFLLWQSSYTEICIADVLWPDFRPEHLLDAIIKFQKRERRLGGA